MIASSRCASLPWGGTRRAVGRGGGSRGVKPNRTSSFFDDAPSSTSDGGPPAPGVRPSSDAPALAAGYLLPPPPFAADAPRSRPPPPPARPRPRPRRHPAPKQTPRPNAARAFRGGDLELRNQIAMDSQVGNIYQAVSGDQSTFAATQEVGSRGVVCARRGRASLREEATAALTPPPPARPPAPIPRKTTTTRTPPSRPPSPTARFRRST